MTADGSASRMIAERHAMGLAWSSDGMHLAISSEETLMVISTDG